MLSKKKLVNVDDAEPGMVLSAAVVDERGAVLLPDETVLTEATLKSLRRRGIEMVYVVNDAITSADLAAERERVQQRLASLFSKCGTDRACGVLLQRITAYRLGELE